MDAIYGKTIGMRILGLNEQENAALKLKKLWRGWTKHHGIQAGLYELQKIQAKQI
jgi:hypothetical protein